MILVFFFCCKFFSYFIFRFFKKCISVRKNIPMVMCRKEAKSYGTKQMIEGIWKNGQNCVIIEDVVTSGSSVSSVAQVNDFN